LNKISVKNRHFLFFILEIFDCLSDIKSFSKIDIQNIYYCIRINKNKK